MNTEYTKDELWKQIDALRSRLHTGSYRERWETERRMKILLEKVKE